MLTELERAIRFGALLGRIESLREKINRIHDSDPDDFATFVAQIPVSDDPDWDVEDSLSNDVCNAWAAWEDATLESLTGSSPGSSKAAAAAVTSSPLSNERLDKSTLRDTQSDASTLAILVQKFVYRPKRIRKDDGDGQPSAMHNNGFDDFFDHGYAAIHFGSSSATDIRIGIFVGHRVGLLVDISFGIRVDTSFGIRKCGAWYRHPGPARRIQSSSDEALLSTTG
ncbi:hypothetical protein CSHISOI_10408 [Colletotrichum shisoi]|uniref:Uncharacterized protein n=1 Tax=Colletotrichum shisoi TaxID=2078593 RepID=A0A5Q4BEM5_9PEZI|nr:hypothetical protein CSHISOI_10408 [Colletotrichum shisoi]